MLMKLMTKIAGPRVMLGVLLFSLVSLGTLGWMLKEAYQDKGAIEEKANKYKQVANENADKVSRLAADALITEQTLTSVRRERQKLESEYNAIIEKNKQAGEQGSEEYQNCRPIPVPNTTHQRMRDAIKDANSVSLPSEESDS